MTPIEKVQCKADAISILGLCGSETRGEIRKAWKRKALETHPDQTGGDTALFLKAKAAYELLLEDEDVALDEVREAVRPSRVMPRRPGQEPKVAIRERRLTPEAQEDCLAALRDAPAEGTHDHVVELVQAKGRSLVYIVAGQISAGTNRVALPADILVTNHAKALKIVSFNVPHMTSGDVVVPDQARTEMFPGARSVRIRFSPNLRRH